jgi:hypothetical protein
MTDKKDDLELKTLLETYNDINIYLNEKIPEDDFVMGFITGKIKGVEIIIKNTAKDFYDKVLLPHIQNAADNILHRELVVVSGSPDTEEGITLDIPILE